MAASDVMNILTIKVKFDMETELKHRRTYRMFWRVHYTLTIAIANMTTVRNVKFTSGKFNVV
jgi:hypothetical protein